MIILLKDAKGNLIKEIEGLALDDIQSVIKCLSVLKQVERQSAYRELLKLIDIPRKLLGWRWKEWQSLLLPKKI